MDSSVAALRRSLAPFRLSRNGVRQYWSEHYQGVKSRSLTFILLGCSAGSPAATAAAATMKGISNAAFAALVLVAALCLSAQVCAVE